MTKKKFPLLAVSLAIALAAASGIAVRSMLRAERAEARLREIYEGAVLSALRQMEDMDLALSKALLSDESGSCAPYLHQVSTGAAQVQRSLSLLPLSHTATQSAVKFANQLEDYTGLLLKNASLTDEDAARLGTLMQACRQSAGALYAARGSLPDQASAGSERFYPLEDAEQPAYDSTVAYPTLIYDGPFSDARSQGEAKALGSRMVTQEDALRIARDFVGEDRVISASPGAEMGGAIPCWGVTLRLSDVTLQAAVTRQGGKILWMSPDAASFPAQRSVEECRENALTFLHARGYEGMQPTYFQVYEGVAVISFAATQGETLLYPDLIKVQLRMDTAQVVGWEARNYLQNHTARGLLVPALSEEQARAQVGRRLEVEKSRLCLIPTDSEEKLCYEFQGTYGGHTYLTYINALDGRQEDVLKVVEGETGLEAV